MGSGITGGRAQMVVAAEPFIDTGTTAWMLTSTALVLLMVPGLAMFYGGLVRTKNVLGTMMHSFVAIAIIGVLWTVCGYSLAFGKSILGGFIGWNSDYFMLSGIDETITDGVPEYVLAMFQGKFAIITPALIIGGFSLSARDYEALIGRVVAAGTRLRCRWTRTGSPKPAGAEYGPDTPRFKRSGTDSGGSRAKRGPNRRNGHAAGPESAWQSRARGGTGAGPATTGRPAVRNSRTEAV